MASTFAAQLKEISQKALGEKYARQIAEALQKIQQKAWAAAHEGRNHTAITIEPSLAREAHCLLESKIRQEGFFKYSVANIDVPVSTYIEVWW